MEPEIYTITTGNGYSKESMRRSKNGRLNLEGKRVFLIYDPVSPKSCCATPLHFRCLPKQPPRPSHATCRSREGLGLLEPRPSGRLHSPRRFLCWELAVLGFGLSPIANAMPARESAAPRMTLPRRWDAWTVSSAMKLSPFSDRGLVELWHHSIVRFSFETKVVRLWKAESAVCEPWDSE